MEILMKRLVFMLIILLSACATSNNVPPSIQSPPANNLVLRLVILNTDNFIGQQVRWGGKIINVSSDNGHSTMEIEHFPLNRYGSPLINLRSQGTFIVQSDQFFDPDLYQQGLLITFSGTIKSEITRTVNRKEYFLPIITSNDFHLWPYTISGGKAVPVIDVKSRNMRHNAGRQ
jgi:outer membrane lipoprotein